MNILLIFGASNSFICKILLHARALGLKVDKVEIIILYKRVLGGTKNYIFRNFQYFAKIFRICLKL